MEIFKSLLSKGDTKMVIPCSGSKDVPKISEQKQ